MNIDVFDMMEQMGMPNPKKNDEFRQYLLKALTEMEDGTYPGSATADDTIPQAQAGPNFSEDNLRKMWRVVNDDHAGINTRNQATDFIIDAYQAGVIDDTSKLG